MLYRDYVAMYAVTSLSFICYYILKFWDFGIAFVCVCFAFLVIGVFMTFELDKLHNPLYIA